MEIFRNMYVYVQKQRSNFFFLNCLALALAFALLFAFLSNHFSLFLFHKCFVDSILFASLATDTTFIFTLLAGTRGEQMNEALTSLRYALDSHTIYRCDVYAFAQQFLEISSNETNRCEEQKTKRMITKPSEK